MGGAACTGTLSDGMQRGRASGSGVAWRGVGCGGVGGGAGMGVGQLLKHQLPPSRSVKWHI